MSLQKITKQLRREMTANPKKAGLLGFGFLVAMYFWAPLVWGWLPKSDKPADAPASPMVTKDFTAMITTTPAKVPDGKNDAVVHPWRKVAEWIDGDARTQASGAWKLDRDPFVPPKEPAMAVVKPKEPPKPKVVATPAALGLGVSSIMAGPRGRVARINGKSYVAGDTVTVSKDDVPVAVFDVLEVQARTVVLEREGQRFPLQIPFSTRLQLSKQ